MASVNYRLPADENRSVIIYATGATKGYRLQLLVANDNSSRTWKRARKGSKEKTKDSKKREQPGEQSQGTYLHTVARGRNARVEPLRASKGPFYACGRKGSVKLSYRAVYFFISQANPACRAVSTRKGWFLRPTDFPIAVLWRVNTLLRGAPRAPPLC